MKGVHIAVGVIAIALNTATFFWGAWCYWRAEPSAWFWRLLRAAQISIVVQAALGGVLVAMGDKPKGIHVVYGLLPIAVSFIGEQLRIASAQMILDSRGLDSAQAVGELPSEEQRGVVVAIVQREIGVMTLAALVIVVLLVRAAAVAG